MSRRGFICAGCWTTDRIKLVDRWPAQEELALIHSIAQQGGGSAHNVGIDLRKLDDSLPVSTVGMIGKDQDGDFLLDQAKQNGIDTQQLYRSDKLSTSYTDVLSVIDTGKRTFFHFTGANDLLTPEHFNFSNRNEKILHLGLLSVQAGMDASIEGYSNGWAKVLKNAQANSILTSIEMVSIDPDRNRELAIPCLPYLDYLVVNDHEIGAIANLTTLESGKTNIDLCIDAARKAMEMGSMKLVTVHYPEGAICLLRDGTLHRSPSLSVPQSYIKGSVGAGDAFVAGFLYALHERWTIPDALKLGHCVAAVSLGSPTTVGAVQSVAQCQKIAEQLHLELGHSCP